MNSIDVCNLALAYIGNTQSIASMAEQTKGAILCGRFYNLTREQLLKAFPWNFAVKTEDLTEVTTEMPRWRSMAICRASSAISTCRVGRMHQPTILRVKRSSTVARYSQPSPVGM